jgi:predicted metalloprotease
MRWSGQGESANVEDRRGMRPVAVGGGIVGLIIVVLGLIFGVDLRQFAELADGGGKQMREVGPPPNDQTRKFVGAVLLFTEEVWTDEFRKMGRSYEKPNLVLFSEAVQTDGCGTAPSAVGPFYCPADRKVYLDPTFFTELEQKLGGSKAEFSQAYVIAHEVGHHVQNLLGYNRAVKEFERREGKNATVRLELQADYLAGVWAHHGQRKFNFIEPGDVEAALTTARAIGDDRIQKRSRGWVSPESFTHGSAAARLRWFREGLESGDTRRMEIFFEARLGELDPALRGQ